MFHCSKIMYIELCCSICSGDLKKMRSWWMNMRRPANGLLAPPRSRRTISIARTRTARTATDMSVIRAMSTATPERSSSISRTGIASKSSFIFHWPEGTDLLTRHLTMILLWEPLRSQKKQTDMPRSACAHIWEYETTYVWTISRQSLFYSK